MKSSGYTLIEMMVVVALIGIIATIAYPAYQGYIRSTYQAQALADLKTCSMSLEKYYSNGFTYAGADTESPPVCTMWSPSDGPAANKKFTITMPTLTKTNFVIKATPNSSAEGECVQLSADGTQASC